MEQPKKMNAATTEVYISSFPEPIQKVLNSVRATIRSEAPEAEEKIGYGIAGFYLKGKPLVYFAAFKNHIGFYATPTGHEAFKNDLSQYKQGKGSVQFPLSEPMPLDLIRRIVRFRIETQKRKM